MLASYDSCASVVSLHADVSLEEVVFDKDSGTAHLSCVVVGLDHAHLMRDMKCVAREVSHIIVELVALNDDVGSLAWNLEVRLLDVDDASSGTNVVPELVIFEYN